MDVAQNVLIQRYNTFGIAAEAEFFANIEQVSDLPELLKDPKFQGMSKFILGGGSNILLTQNVPGLTIKMNIKGVELVDENDYHYLVKAGAGENWHSFVLKTLKQKWYGLENLSLIPGNVGASPMQNIGAYGIEIKERFESLEALNMATGELEQFKAEDCAFGYRESVFKRELKGQYIITSVTYRLPKKPDIRTTYGAIQSELERMQVGTVTPEMVSKAVINIRSSKLPDPKEIGNAGSFFKNPVIPNEQFKAIQKEHPDIAAYPAGEDHTKVAAGWLIDQAGWKGKSCGHYGVHKNQALVLVNYQGATGQEIYDLSEAIRQDVLKKYGIKLEREVNIV